MKFLNQQPLESFENDRSIYIDTATSTLGVGGKIALFKNNNIASFRTNIQASTSLAADYTLTLPPTPGSAGQVLITDGAGTLSYATISGTGTVTSVSGTGTVSGLSLSGTVTTSGDLTLSGTLEVVPSNFAVQTANKVLVGPASGSDATPTFRTLVAADIPSLSYQPPLNVTGILKSNGTSGNVSAASAGTDYAAPDQTMYLGTTAIALNRASATGLSLAGVSVDGSAGSVAAANLTGATLASGVTGSSLTSVGTLNGVTVGGNITITGTARRITGDFSNATVANRVAFQSSTTDTNTILTVYPNGTATTTGINFYSTPDPLNANLAQLSVINTEVRIQANALGTSSYIPMTFYTGGSESVRIGGTAGTDKGTVGIGYNSLTNVGVNGLAVAGKVGAGTNAPTNILEVQETGTGTGNGGLTVSTATTGGNAGIRFKTASTENWQITTAGVSGSVVLRFYDIVNSAERMRIDANGNVGIGTTSTSLNALNVVAKANTNYAMFDAPTSGYAYASLKYNGTFYGYFGQGNGVFTGGINNDFGIRAENSLVFGIGTTEKMRLHSNGYVGIGNTAPSGLLTLGAASGTNGNIVLNGSTSGSVTIKTAVVAGTWSMTLPVDAGSDGYLLKTDGNGVTSWVGVGSGGTTYIGTTSLSLTRTSANQALTGITSITGGSSVSQSLTLQSTSGIGTSDSILFKVGNNGATTAMTIDTNGNVGIGTTPSIRLEVSASATGGTASASPSTFRVLASTLGTVAGNDINFGGYQANTGADASRLNTHIQRTATGTDWTTTAMGLSYDVDTTVGAGGQLWFYNGNVGVGTSSPSSRLEVKGAGSTLTDAVLRINNPSTATYSTSILDFYSNGRTRAAIYGQQDNTGLGGYLIFNNSYTSGVVGETMRIDSSGNVGIGTTSPQGKLNVGSGRSYFGANSETYSIGVGYTQARVNSGQVYYIGATDSATPSMVFSAATGTETMRIDSSGNVGINYASPAAKLHVSTTSSTAYGLISQSPIVGLTAGNYVNMAYFADARSTNNDGLRIVNVRDSTGSGNGNWETSSYRIRRSVDYNDGATGVQEEIVFGTQFLAFGTSGSERMRIDSSGNVGIGTSSPSNKLTVAGNIQVTGAYAVYVPSASSGSNGIIFGADANASSRYWKILDNTSAYGLLDFQVSASNSDASYTSKMVIDASGNVGIGTSNPAGYSAKIAAVATSDYSTAATFISNSSTVNWARTDWDNQNVAYNGIIYQDQSGLFNIRNDGANSIAFSTNGGNERMRIDSSGNVGIGTSSPRAKLEVDSGALMAGTSAGVVLYGRGQTAYPTSGLGYFSLSTNNTDATNGGLSVNTLTSGTLTEKMRIDTSGNVGIGTNSPSTYSSTYKKVLSIGLTDQNLTLGAYYQGGTGQYSIINSSTGTASAGADLAFQAGSSETMRITSSGNVGIGTNSPSYSLVVSKNQNAATVFQLVNNNTGASAASILQSQIGASSYVNYSAFAAYNQIVGSGITTQYIDFDTQIFRTTGGSERMRIDSSGNMGIGTTSSLDKLTVNGAIKVYGSSGLQTGTIAANTMFLDYYGGTGRFLSYGANTTTNGTFSWYQGKSDNSSGQTVMAIDSNGNVGIGTTSPSGKLEIDQNYNAGSPSLYLNQPVATWGTTSLFQSYRFIQTNSAATDGNFRAFHVGAGGVGIGYATPPAYGSSDALYVNGRVGIGTTAPAGTLQVVGTIRTGAGPTDATNATIAMYNDGTGASIEAFQGNDATVKRNLWLNAYGGNVGIGTATPSEKLNVSGNILASGNITAYSDIKLKTNITTIDNALDKVSRMRGVMFTRKDTGAKGTGVIAQEMQEVLPEVVQDGETLSVAYGNIVGVLIEAIKELKAEIEQLKGNK